MFLPKSRIFIIKITNNFYCQNLETLKHKYPKSAKNIKNDDLDHKKEDIFRLFKIIDALF